MVTYKYTVCNSWGAVMWYLNLVAWLSHSDLSDCGYTWIAVVLQCGSQVRGKIG